MPRPLPPLPPCFRRHLAAHRLFPEPGLAVLAVSGGADSLALLDLMAGAAAALDLTLVVAHADHGIGPESGAVAARVGEAASRYGLEAAIGRLTLGPGASETRARTARYRFLRGVQAERGARYLVTAHHADDQAETVVLRLLRGTGPLGLAGIPARGPGGLVRPLLPFSRADLAKHVRDAGLEPFDDPANRDPRHLRSWVRSAVLPALAERLGPAARRALLETARHARVERRAWDAVIDVLPGLDAVVAEGRLDVARDALRGYDKCLAGRVLRAAAARAGMTLGPRAASLVVGFAATAASGRRVAIGGGLEAEVAFGRLRLSRPAPVPGAVPFAGARGACEVGRYRLAWRSARAPQRVPRGGWSAWFTVVPALVRPLAEGDRLVPLGGVGRRKVSRLLMEAKVPRGERTAYPVVVGAGDEVLWVPGVCRGAAEVPKPGTRAVRVDATVR